MKLHSALFDEVDVDGEIHDLERDDFCLSSHDILDGVPPYFDRVDAVYSEPSWRQGYDEFKDRVGEDTEKKEYIKYLRSIERVVKELGVPAYILVGNHAMDYLSPNDYWPIHYKEHNYDCSLVLYNGASVPKEELSNKDVISLVTDRYDAIGDFSCGYGNLAVKAKQKGKVFVGTDINAKCLYFISKEIYGVEVNQK